nr:ATP-binding cassette domain-containing protein [Streptomyces sp. NBC_00830]
MPVSFEECTFAYRRNRPVLRSLTFEFPEGRTVFLGPNGAGKSTVLSLAASMQRPDAGTVNYRGRISTRRSDVRPYREQVAWLPQHVDCVPGLTAREQVAYVGWLKGMGRSEAWDRALHALDEVEMRDHSDRKVSELSGGQVRRVGVAQSLVHRAKVLLLDEPTAGMDPRQRRVFHDILGRLSDDVSVILSTHDVSDLDDVYDNVVVLSGGAVQFCGPVSEFLALAQEDVAPGRRAENAYNVVVAGAPCD